jgi:hypothetical protein
MQISKNDEHGYSCKHTHQTYNVGSTHNKLVEDVEQARFSNKHRCEGILTQTMSICSEYGSSNKDVKRVSALTSVRAMIIKACVLCIFT